MDYAEHRINNLHVSAIHFGDNFSVNKKSELLKAILESSHNMFRESLLWTFLFENTTTFLS